MIHDVLNITPNPVEKQEDTNLPATTKNTKIPDQNDHDLEFVRSNYYDIMQKGNEALDELMMVAQQSQNARAYEVVARMIDSLTKANKDLSEIAVTKKKIKSEENENQQTPNNVNNNMFVTTEALQKMLRGEEE